MKKLLLIGGSVIAFLLLVGYVVFLELEPTPPATPVAQSSQATIQAPSAHLVTPTPQATEKPTVKPVIPRPTPVTPTRQTANPVCNEQVTNAPCVLFASVQDAAVGNSSVGAVVHTSENNGIVLVEDDITNANTNNGSPDTSLNATQFQCFNIQQGLWYSLKSTINPDGSKTIRKSAFAEVDITFIDQHIGNGPFASCRLTSTGVDKIDRAGMWDDGDFVGAWSLYDGKSFS